MRMRPRSVACAVMLVVITVSLWLISVRATARSTDALSPAFDAGLESSVTTFDAKLTTQGIEPAVKATRPTRARIAQATLDTNGCTMCATAQCCEVTVASVNPECCDGYTQQHAARESRCADSAHHDRPTR